MEKWRLIKDPPLPGHVNMARDLEILGQVAAGAAPPTLRCYAWSPPAVSLGYFQEAGKLVNEAACRRLGIDIVRRPTGGRALLHDHELTYSVVIPESHRLLPAGVLEAYRLLSGAIAKAFQSLNIDSRLAPEQGRPAKPGPGSCFDTPSAYELQVGGKKVVGSAQLRRSGCLLQHGSIIFKLAPELNRQVFNLPGRARVDWIDGLVKRAAGLWDLGYQVEEEQLFGALAAGFAATFSVTFNKEEALAWNSTI